MRARRCAPLGAQFQLAIGRVAAFGRAAAQGAAGTPPLHGRRASAVAAHARAGQPRLDKAHLRQHARPVRIGEGPAKGVQRRHCARAAEAQHAQLAHLRAARLRRRDGKPIRAPAGTPVTLCPPVLSRLAEHPCGSSQSDQAAVMMAQLAEHVHADSCEQLSWHTHTHKTGQGKHGKHGLEPKSCA